MGEIDSPVQIRHIMDGRIVDADDHVARLKSRIRRGGLSGDLGDQRAVTAFDPEA